MIRWIEETGGQEADSVGKKAAALAELNNNGIKVPQGFVVTIDTWEKFKEYNGIEERIEKHLENADKGGMEDLQEASKRIRSIIRNSEMPEQMEDEIKKAYGDISLSKKVRNGPDQAAELIGGQREPEFVAVRQSRKEVFPDLNHAELNVHGKDKLLEKVKGAWAESYSPESIYMSQVQEKDLDPAVMVQMMVDTEHSASVLTTDPVGQEDDLIIESVHGIGSPLVRGNIQPERYRVDRTNGQIKEKRSLGIDWKLQVNQRTGELEKKKIPRREREKDVLSKDKITEIANLGLNIEGMAGQPINAVIAIEDDKKTVLTVQNTSRAEKRNRSPVEEGASRGTPVSPGNASGLSELYRGGDSLRGNIALLEDLERLENLLPQAVEVIDGAISRQGGISSKISSYLRELGRPLIVDFEPLEEFEGQNISMDGFNGTVSLEGEEESEEKREKSEDPVQPSGNITGTKILTLERKAGGADGSIEPNTARARQKGVYVLDQYSDILKLKELFRNGAEHIVVDIKSLKEKDKEATERALHEAVERSGRENVSVMLHRPSQELIDRIVEIGVNSIIVPPEMFRSFQNQLNRAERKFIMDRLREGRDR